ncbi:hypothetical protein [Shivajiella indica]|uniref:Uncharacterized protein n=1 Tax=Shivajiella indica TaxID=872115 RepID=A0ABW5B7A0_9BACT
MSYFTIEIFFSILVLLTSYFLTSLALFHGYIPGGIERIKEKNGKIRDIIHFWRIFVACFLIASLFSGLMFYVFVFPTYRLT